MRAAAKHTRRRGAHLLPPPHPGNGAHSSAAPLRAASADGMPPPRDADEFRRTGMDGKSPFVSIVRLLRPKFLSWREGWRSRFGGEAEFLCMVVACTSRWYEMSIATSLAYRMETVMASRNTQQFLALLPRCFLWQCVMPATNRLCFRYFQARLTWKWRYRMTNTLHGLYFSNMNYYFIGDGGGTGADKMVDADHRMVDDVKLAVQAVANTGCNALWDACQAFFFSLEVYKRYGSVSALSCFVYPVLSVFVVDNITKVHVIWRRLSKEVGVTKAHYRETVTRVMMNSEAIAALKGVEFEKDIMMRKFDRSLGALLAIHKSGYRYGTLNAFVSRFWSQVCGPCAIMTTTLHHRAAHYCGLCGCSSQFPSWYVLAPLAWSPALMRSGEESVQSIAQERGSIGLKFMLFTRSMQLWNGLFTFYRQLQWVGGNAERLVDLVVLLEKLSARKRTEKAASVVTTADKIAFVSSALTAPRFPLAL